MYLYGQFQELWTSTMTRKNTTQNSSSDLHYFSERYVGNDLDDMSSMKILPSMLEPYEGCFLMGTEGE